MPLSDSELAHIRHLIQEVGGVTNPSGWFEPLYQEAQGDSTQVPWAQMQANPYLPDWLQKQSSPSKHSEALVLGCGLGDDAEALSDLGYQVTAFDISPTAIKWCQQRFPESPVTYEVADLFAPPNNWQSRFALVYECRNFQALPVEVRGAGITAIANCVAPEGRFLLITNYLGDSPLPAGPPWPLSDGELDLIEQQGFRCLRREQLQPPQSNLSPKLRVEYIRQ